MKNPLTVVMPMRDPGRFLEPAVASVLRSAGSLDVELLVIDDGSTDGSRQALARMADTRIRVIDGPRAGIAAAMNLGFAEARGAIVMRCDSDDLFAEDRIPRQLDWLAAHPRHIAVCGPFSTIDANGRPVAMLASRHDQASHVEALLLEGSLSTSLCTFAIRADAARRVGGFRPYFVTAEDIDFTLRLAAIGSIGWLPGSTYAYRLHGASSTHTQPSNLRRFFEAAARSMSRERLHTGSDALMRGEAPNPPARGDVVDGAGKHIASLLVGEAWRLHARGERARALAAAAAALRAHPTSLDAWKAVALVPLKRSSSRA